MKTALIGLALAILPLSGDGQPPKEAAAPAGPPYQLARTETFELPSSETGNTYEIVVAFPEDYAAAPAGQTWPVIYVIDAQWQFPLIYAIAGALIYDQSMASALLVGISWKTTNGNLMALRDRDLTPAGPSRPGYGQAEKLQDFFHDTLLPRIESRYRATAHRTVTGCSTSSLFVFHTLLSRPDLFEGYIGSSPPAVQALSSTLEGFPADGIKRETRAYMTAGGLENSSVWADFADQVRRKNLRNLSFAFATVSGAGHAGENAECYTRGLQFVFAASPRSGRP